MEYRVPTSDIIPAVAARLKYYLDVERKEAGFDLSVNMKDSNKKYRVYHFAGTHALPHNQRPKKNFLENKMKASLQSCSGKSAAEWNQIVQINQEQKQQVQKKIRKKMSSLTIPDRFSSNRVHLRKINWKCSDLENYCPGLSHSSLPDISHGELRRLVTSAANLIVATTTGCPMKHSHQGRTVGQSDPSLCENIPTSWQDHSSNTATSSLGDTGSRTSCDESVDAGFANNQTVPETSEKIDYDIVINTGASSPKEAKPTLCMRLVGENGRSKTLFLQTSLANTTRSGAGQGSTFHMKTRDVGELKHIIIRVDRKQDCRCYCWSITVKKGTTAYVFPCNKWLSPFQTVVAHAMEPVSAANMLFPAAKVSDEDNCQTKKKPSILPSIANAKLHGCRNTSLITTMGFQISSCKPVETDTKANLAEVSKRNVNKSVASHRRAESKESKKSVIRKPASAERRPQKEYRCEMGAPTVSSGNSDGTSRSVSVQVTMVVEPPSKTITADGSKPQSPLGENNLDNDVTAKTTSIIGNLPEQNNLQTEALTTPNYRKASSPASYVGLSHESKESPIIDEVTEHACKNTSIGLTNGDTKEAIRAPSDCMNQSSQYLSSDNTKSECDDGASQLLLLQQVLSESVDKVPASSPRADSQPCSKCFNNAEAVDDHRAKADEDNEVHTESHGYTGSCFQIDSDAGYCCSCGELCSYASDSTLDDDYLLCDISPELSLSEDEDYEAPLKSSHLVTGGEDNHEEHNMRICHATFMDRCFRCWPDEDYLRYTKGAEADIYREVRVDSCCDTMNVFKSSLAAIHSHDDIKLRNLCQSHIFIPSFTDEDGKTLLHHAAVQEDPIICQVLLDTNVGKMNIDHQDMFGKTALHYAVQNGNTKTIELLLEYGAKREIGKTACNTE